MKTPIRIAVAAAALGLAACAPPGEASRAAAAPTRARAFAERVDGAPNLARVHAGLYRSGQPDDGDFPALRERGIRTVVNLRANHFERNEVRSSGMDAVEIPLSAGPFDADPPTDEQVRHFFEVVLDPARQPVLFHCAHGKDRTGTMAALYRIEVDGWSPEEAIAEMQAFGFRDHYGDLLDFVRAYRPRGFRAPAFAEGK